MRPKPPEYEVRNTLTKQSTTKPGGKLRATSDRSTWANSDVKA